MHRHRVEVAAAVLQRDDGSFLLAQRPAGKAYGGYWEFPGGKVEPGEAADQALRRELHEELGIDALTFFPWLTRDYDYPHAAVRLRFFRVTHWRGQLHGRESQQFAWQSARDITVDPLLPANGPIVRALDLPPVYGISHGADLDADAWVKRVERALQRGLRMFQIREKSLAVDRLLALCERARCMARGYGARVLVNGSVDLARRCGADGIHLTSAQLRALAGRPEGFDLVGASCHDANELEHARTIDADFVVLGPVQPTASHPGATTLGWSGLKDLIRDYSLPVYALGGMRPSDLTTAWESGAHGISMMRGAWQE
jgi:8-oxo-dGTP diphosphatase